MDPNLIKIRDANIHLIKKGRLGKPITQAKHYLTEILGEYRLQEIDVEMDEFVDHLKDMANQAREVRKSHKKRRAALAPA